MNGEITVNLALESGRNWVVHLTAPNFEALTQLQSERRVIRHAFYRLNVRCWPKMESGA